MKTTLLQLGRLLGAGFLALTLGQASAQSTAKLQAIHNSADPAAETLDVWVSIGGTDQLFIDDFSYLDATEFRDVNAGIPITISLAPSTSTSITDTIPGTSFEVTLTEDGVYVIMALGNVGTGFAANPDGKSTGFMYKVIENALMEADKLDEVAFTIVHGSTDAPTVDVYVSGTSVKLADDAAYGDNTAYIAVAEGEYRIDITPADTTNQLFGYYADLSDLGGSAMVIFASGYLTPANNNDGEAFGLYAALADGTVVPLDVVTSVKKAIVSNALVYPNPSNGTFNLNWNASNTGTTNVIVYSMDGRVAFETAIAEVAGANNINLDLNKLNGGVYLLRMDGASGTYSARIQVAK